LIKKDDYTAFLPSSFCFYFSFWAEAEATAGEVAPAVGSAATPAEAATASTSLSPFKALHTLSSSIVHSFFNQKSMPQFVCNRKNYHAVYSNRI
jgi:hypothetical protein